MLCVKLQRDEWLVLGPEIRVLVLEAGDGGVRLGIDAPPELIAQRLHPASYLNLLAAIGSLELTAARRSLCPSEQARLSRLRQRRELYDRHAGQMASAESVPPVPPSVESPSAAET